MLTSLSLTRVLIVALFSWQATACGAPPEDDLSEESLPRSEGAPSAANAPAADDIGLVELAILTVPDAITCLRVDAQGPYRKKIDLLDTTPGVEFKQTLSGYPLGLIRFRADAFAKTCSEVDDRTVSSWTSDPVTASVVDGSKTRVVFDMHRNGRVDAVFDFSEEPACSADGVPCRSGRECCSKSCSAGLCQAAPAQ